MKAHIMLAALLVLLTPFALLAVSGCGGAPVGAPGGEAGGEAATRAAERPKATPGLQVTADLQRQWGISVGQPTRATASGAVVLSGVLRLNQQRTAQISSLLPGKVVSLGADVGMQVRKGQVLATIHAPALAQAKTTFLQAGAKLEQARREYERARMLLQQEAIDQKETLRRKTEFDNASSELGVAESNLHSFGIDQMNVDALLKRARQGADQVPHEELTDPYLQLVSPLDGRVIERDVLTGQYIEPQKPLFTVSDLTTLWAVLDAREADLPHLAAGRSVRVRTSVYPDRTWDGRLAHIGDVVDEKSRTVKVRVDTPNIGLLLKPNMFIQGDVLDAASSREVLTVPEEAIQTFNGDSVVFVRSTPDHFLARPVEPGERMGNRRVILKGLGAADVIALSGAFNLKAELLKSSLGGE
jgi:cobalt-zinc-cadmium efflux system membrane fusion protein